DFSSIYFTSNASDKFDGNFDAYKMFSPDYISGVPHIFSIIETDETPVSINALPEIKLQEKTVSLGIRINTSGTYTIFIDEFNFDNSKVYLIDKQENTEICLNDVKSYSFDFVAGDDRNRFELKFIQNTKPVLNIELFDLEAYEDDILDLNLSENTFIDYDNDDYITYSARLSNNNQLPSWMTFDDLNVTFSGTPNNDDVGLYDIELKATDRFGAFGTTMFRLNILNVNDIPTLANQIPDMTTNLGDYYSYNIPVNTFMDVDLGDKLVLSAKLADGSELPFWLSFDPLSNTLSGISENIEIFDIIITATDNYDAKTNSSFKLTVKSSLFDNNSDEIIIYPNPTSGKFNILNFEGTVIITDISGKVIMKRDVESDFEKFDISNYAIGNYLIRLISDDISEERIIIKQ
ncbi:MAG: putative Ig domain-containing protein, partial [Bacteroidota bacterium]|nr:putative Ig domain-containing protein [Bacteroidota bacterium]